MNTIFGLNNVLIGIKIDTMKKILFKKIDASGLAVFRIFYMTILFCELLQLYNFRGIIYGHNSVLNFGEFDPNYIFKFWFIIVIFLFFGLFTRVSSIINYLFSIIIFSSAAAYEYHVFYAYVGLNFLLMFMPVSRVLSLDNLIKKIKYSDIGGFYKTDNKVLAANYLMPVFVGIGLVYFDSILFKFSSPMWLKGLGMWLPANLPMATWNDTSWLMNQEYLVKFLGYLVIAFETVFIFLFWFKPFRVPFMLIGIFFHLGILLEFPIPWFALTAVAVYLLMVPVSWWKKSASFLKAKNPNYKFYYDAECPLCIKTVVIIKHFDVFNKVVCLSVQGNYHKERALENRTEQELLFNIHGVNANGKVMVGYYAYAGLLKALIYTFPLGLFLNLPIISNLGKRAYLYIAGNRLTVRCTSESCAMPIIQKPYTETQDYLIEGFNQLNLTKKFWSITFVFFILAQGINSWNSPLNQNVLGLIKLRNTRINAWAMKPYEFFSLPLVKYYGITQHPVFMDGHFGGYNHIIKTEFHTFDGKVFLVPIINENGTAGNYIHGAFWVNYTFRVSAPLLNKIKFESGIIPYLNYFALNKPTLLPKGKYVFYIKEIEIPNDWKKDFLKIQMEKPWIRVGEFEKDGTNNIFTWTEQMQQIFEEEKK